jgi:hypothetical protein
MSDLTAIKNDILLAIRNGTFPAELSQKGHAVERQLEGVRALHKQRHIAIAQFDTNQTGQGDDFVLQELEVRKMPRKAQLTLSGERIVDRKLGIDSSELESKGIMALLQVLSKGPLDNFESVKMPEGIGPLRKDFLIRDIKEQGFITIEKAVEEQGFFRVGTMVAKITLAGALAFAERNTTTSDLEGSLKSVRRQVLLRALEKPIPDTSGNIRTELPGWGEALFAVAKQLLLDAGLITVEQRALQQGFFRVSRTVLALTETPSVQAAVTFPTTSPWGKSGKVSGRQIAEGILHHPDASIEVVVPARKSETKPRTLTL